MYIRSFILIFGCVSGVISLEKGQPCNYNNTAGVCRSIDECEVVKRQVEDERAPIMCSWEGQTRIVCCPLASIIGWVDKESRQFLPRSPQLNCSFCHYDGRQLTITPEDKPQPEEPVGCPKLNRPSLSNNPYQVAYEKCLDYQRFVNVCVASERNPNEYVRQSACGIQSLSFRTSGAPLAASKEFPHMAALGYQNKDAKRNLDVIWAGGGTLISDRFILTAAHVVYSFVHGVLRYALLGSLSTTNTTNGAFYLIKEMFPFPAFDYRRKPHDIALLKLDRRVLLSEFIRPACLPVPGMTLDGPWISAGWGHTENTQQPSDVLLKKELHEAEGGSCQKTFGSSNFQFNSTNMICVAGNQFAATCRGYSGSPLMQEINGDHVYCSYAVVGVASFGTPTCSKDVPGVYTKVTNDIYMTWIVNTVWPK